MSLCFQRRHREIYSEKKTDAEQPKLNDFIIEKYNKNDPRQQQLTEALVIYIAGDLLPLSTVDSENFKNLMEHAEPRYQMPSRTFLTSKLLHEKSTEVKNNLKGQLKKGQSVCLTIGFWSNRQMRGFLGITGHFILDWALKSVMIFCKRFKGKHTAEHIRV